MAQALMDQKVTGHAQSSLQASRQVGIDPFIEGPRGASARGGGMRRTIS